MTKPRYAVLLRPASTHTLPKVGWDYVAAPAPIAAKRGLPVSTDYPHGIIETERALTAEEIEHFDLRRVDVSPDFAVGSDGGSIYTFTPLTDSARKWLDENVSAESWQFLGGSLAVDHHFIADLVDGAQADGFTVQ